MPHNTMQDRLTIKMNRGVATWKYMYIDRPGIYSLLFSSDMKIEWPFIMSHRLTVGVCATSLTQNSRVANQAERPPGVFVDRCAISAAYCAAAHGCGGRAAFPGATQNRDQVHFATQPPGKHYSLLGHCLSFIASDPSPQKKITTFRTPPRLHLQGRRRQPSNVDQSAGAGVNTR